MRRTVFVLCCLVPAVPAAASDSREERALKQLDPDARFEQVCDLEAMRQIGKDTTYRPERSVVGALAPLKVVETTMSGSGGAFKSKGQWFRFSFTCQTTPDHMRVQGFSLKIGEPIPEETWEKNGLW